MASLSPLIEEILSQGCSIEFTVTGNSMRPLFHHKVSRVRLAPMEKLKKGDIPLYRRDSGAFVFHRIISLDGETFTCCGDNQWHLEPNLRPDQVLAVMTDFSRDGERWTSCQSCLYGLYWRFWVAMRPLRHLLFGGMRRLRRILTNT